jgi:DNA-binding beta-propeller fold protein YncE
VEKPYQMLLFDGAAHKIIHIDGSNGSIIAEVGYPPDIEPVDTATFDDKIIYILAINETTNKGIIFQYLANERKLSPDKKLRPLPIPDISPLQIAIDDKKSRLIIACEDGSLYIWQNHALSLLGHTQQGAICVGIQIVGDYIYTIWEHEQGGIIALLNEQGLLLDEFFLPGIPTHLAVTATGLLLVSYTCTLFTGEGLALLETSDAKLACPKAIPFNCPFQPIKTYPTFIAISPTENTAYVIHEDGGFISKIDLTEKKLAATWLISHSISSLHFLPDDRFAIGPSFKFADLTLIDINAGEAVSITNSPERRLLGLMRILPPVTARKQSSDA